MGQLRIIRGSEWFGRIRNLYVHVDDNQVGTVSYNDYKDFALSDGQHELYVVIDTIKSQVISINIDNTRPSIFRVRLPDVFNPLKLIIAVFDSSSQISFEPISLDARVNKF